MPHNHPHEDSAPGDPTLLGTHTRYFLLHVLIPLLTSPCSSFVASSKPGSLPWDLAVWIVSEVGDCGD